MPVVSPKEKPASRPSFLSCYPVKDYPVHPVENHPVHPVKNHHVHHSPSCKSIPNSDTMLLEQHGTSVAPLFQKHGV